MRGQSLRRMKSIVLRVRLLLVVKSGTVFVGLSVGARWERNFFV